MKAVAGLTKKRKKFSVPLDYKHGVIDLSHGSGGRAMSQLIEEVFAESFDNEWLAQKNDQACFSIKSGRMVMTTDAYVISPLFFPGGNIGSLAVHGTINDIAMAGAKPLYLSASFILEEGFPLNDLQKIVKSMASSAKESNVSIITGDTKVVERGKGDGIFITTSGVGIVPVGVHLSGNQAKAGDHVLVSGYMGDHGIAILAHRANLEFETTIISDSAPLHHMVASMIEQVPSIRCLRDPTRGGLATVLNEWAEQSDVGFYIEESKVPIRVEVRSACELLGLDAMYIANEGKLVAICPAKDSNLLLGIMREHPLGKNAAIIGEVIADSYNLVQLKTNLGGMRIMDQLTGEQLPRIC